MLCVSFGGIYKGSDLTEAVLVTNPVLNCSDMADELVHLRAKEVLVLWSRPGAIVICTLKTVPVRKRAKQWDVFLTRMKQGT